jgi:flagellar motor switch protein FliN/FliY
MSMSETSLTTQAGMASATVGTERLSSIRGQIRAIPFRLSVSVPLHGWKLGRICALKQGQLLLTGVSAAEDVPVCVGGALLGYAELDNVDGQMAVRLTRLS